MSVIENFRQGHDPHRPFARDISPVRLSINHHRETLGLHRFRFRFDAAIAQVLARGLNSPRVHIDGTTVNGFRVWCAEEGGMAPVRSRHTGAWDVTVPVRRVRGREKQVESTSVEYAWTQDETGPVLLIPRVPDPLLPEEIVNKLPNVAVDPETRFERVSKRLEREMLALKDESLLPSEHAPALASRARDADAQGENAADESPVPVPPEHPQDSPSPSPSPHATDDSTHAPDMTAVPNAALSLVRHNAALPGAPVDADARANIPLMNDPIPDDVSDLKAALSLVNELKERMGDNVVLYVDGEGRVQAKRRVISYIDL